jgi:hypothetical protein
MNLTLLTLLRAIPLVAVALAPEIANASNVSCGDPYYDPCNAFSGWIDISIVSTGKIPIDGVLVLQGAFQNDAPGPGLHHPHRHQRRHTAPWQDRG